MPRTTYFFPGDVEADPKDGQRFRLPARETTSTLDHRQHLVRDTQRFQSHGKGTSSSGMRLFGYSTLEGDRCLGRPVAYNLEVCSL